MARISWGFFSERRKINLKNLVESGIVRDYATFQSYCQGLEITPLSLSEFEKEFGPFLSTSNSQQAVASVVSSIENVSSLEATVWLAGIEEELKPPSKPVSSKKKKDTPADTKD